jgi:hypothetical protein
MAEKFLDKVGAALETAARETEKAARIGKLKLDQLALERERDRLFTRLGKMVYRLLEEGREVSPEVPEVARFREEIGKTEKNIESKLLEIERVKNGQ